MIEEKKNKKKKYKEKMSESEQSFFLKGFPKVYDQQGQRKVAGRSEAIRGPR